MYVNNYGYNQWQLVAQIDGGTNMRQWYILTLLYNNNNNNNNNNK
jgi:hypothetical protein